MNFEESLIKNNIKLPEPKAPVGSYVATKIAGKLLYISGQISISENGELINPRADEGVIKSSTPSNL